MNLIDDCWPAEPPPVYLKRWTRGPVSNLPLIGRPGCWCGQQVGHDWPGKEDGTPHPR